MVSFTNNTFHNSQILLCAKVSRYCHWSSNAIFGSAIILSLSTFTPSHWSSKLVNVAIGPLLFAVSNRLDRLRDYASGYGAISETQSHMQYRNWLDASLQPPKREIQVQAPVEPTAPVKYAPIETSLKKPHLMILGETGSGKSTICKYLVSQVNAPCVIIDPHASPTDWKGFTVIGSGRNYGDIANEFERLANLMQIRYEQRDQGVTQFDPLIVIIDEFPAIASSLGKGATDTVKLLAREARKVSIRMCLLSQGAEVKTLGLEGEGSIRECFAMLRLGNFALSHGKSLKDKAIGEALESNDRPAMLDQLPCNLPVLSDAQTMPVLPLPSDYQAMLDSPKPQTIVKTVDSLSEPMQIILQYLESKAPEWVKDNAVANSSRRLPLSTEDTRSYLQWLADQGFIECRKTGAVAVEARSLTCLES
jgi:energy-coupling factor transporter ATP-binding protein EcfA2